MNEYIGNYLYSFFYATAIIAGPPLIVATALGLMVALLQAVTQIQDQTLAQTVKIISIATILFFFGALLAGPLLSQSRDIFETFPAIVG